MVVVVRTGGWVLGRGCGRVMADVWGMGLLGGFM